MASNSCRKRLFQTKTCVSQDTEDGAEENIFCIMLTVRKAIQHVVEHASRNKALKMLRSSTAS